MTEESRPVWALRLQSERSARGWSKAELGRRLLRESGAHRTLESVTAQIRAWEGGRNFPRDWADTIALVLGIDRDTLFPPAERSPRRFPAESAGITPDDEERLVLAARRPTRIDMGVVESLAAILAAQRRTEDAIGSAALLAPVRAQLDAIGPLVIDARGPIRTEMMAVAAQWAQFSGWLHAATGDFGTARGWFDRAAEWAAEVPGPVGASLAASVHSYRGHLAWRSGDIGPMIGQSQAAARVTGAHPAELTFAAIQEARGHAIVGDQTATERTLDQVDVMAEAADAQRAEAPPWAYFHGSAFYALGRGATYRFLAEQSPAYAARSVDLLTHGLTELGEARRSEWAAWFVYQLATVHMLAGNRTEACRTAIDAADVVRVTRSPEMTGRLHRLHSRLAARWPTDTQVTELGEALP
ncbi:hypothetical protein DPM19_13130 [Actinomadura craniellae]|uniref:XRE family transcriptional regulator n=1 Tax=Actinomadura craniellae TaxID=2231787 RepID=A0A365H6E8_9ACTN|nr:helix-turn-helix transcriptional regulator [Actinomadura craniellae]RAY14690.1 hypothetical protein DPM19_13130 [Actinomadura craniellae]